MPEATTERPSRNAPCPCGSGKKYKRCCLKKDQEAERQARSEAEAQLATSLPEEQHEDPPETETEDPPSSMRHPWKRSHDPAFQRFLKPGKRGG